MAAATLLNRDPNASLEAIATEAGLSRRAIYGHFATRDALLRELTIHGAARINRAMLASASEAGPDDPALQLAETGARIWRQVDHIRVMALLTVRGPRVELVGDALAPLREHVRGIVERGVEAGVFRTDIAVDRLSRLVESAAISVLDEAVRYSLSSKDGRRMVVLSVLSMAGFSSREAGEILVTLDSRTPDSSTLPEAHR
jgi:AcrR family transcriptional regulator